MTTRNPLPPDVLASALQDRTHPASGQLISATPIAQRKEESMNTKQLTAAERRCAECKHWDRPKWMDESPGAFTNTTATCSKLRHVVDISIDQGSSWGSGGATLECIDTPEDFGCTAWECRAVAAEVERDR